MNSQSTSDARNLDDTRQNKASPTDDWVGVFFRDADTLDVQKLTDWFAETVEVRFGNSPAIIGKEAAALAFTQFFGSLSGMRHLRETLLIADDLAAQMSVVTYMRHDGSEVSMPVASHLRRVAIRKIDRLWIYIDMAPLYAVGG